MRVIHVIVPDEKSSLVEKAIRSLDVSFVKFKGDKENLYILEVSSDETELVVDALRKIGVGVLYGSLSLQSTELLMSSRVKKAETQSRFIGRATREELLVNIEERARLSVSYILFLLSSSIIAALGLLYDNVIMVIASMIIAPLIGPIVGLALGTTIGLTELQKESLKSEAIGILLSISIGFIIGLMNPFLEVNEQIALRANPMYTDIIFAVAAGLAAALSIISLEALALVGVAIAASILPPAVNVGIGLAFYLRGHSYGEVIVAGSSTLLLINILAINFTTLLFFWVTGITTKVSARRRAVVVRNIQRRLLFILLLIIVVSYPIITATQSHFKRIEIESKIKKSVSSYIEENEPGVKIIDIKVDYIQILNNCEIYIELAGSKDIDLEALASRIDNYIEASYRVNTEVYILMYSTSEASGL